MLWNLNQIFTIFCWEEDILNIVCKLISTILCDWHYVVICQHNSWANFILRQLRKWTILFLQGSVGTRNRYCGQYMHCFVGNLFRCKSKIIKFGWDFTKLCQFNIKQMEMCSFLGHHVCAVSLYRLWWLAVRCFLMLYSQHERSVCSVWCVGIFVYSDKW